MLALSFCVCSHVFMPRIVCNSHVTRSVICFVLLPSQKNASAIGPPGFAKPGRASAISDLDDNCQDLDAPLHVPVVDSAGSGHLMHACMTPSPAQTSCIAACIRHLYTLEADVFLVHAFPWPPVGYVKSVIYMNHVGVCVEQEWSFSAWLNMPGPDIAFFVGARCCGKWQMVRAIRKSLNAL